MTVLGIDIGGTKTHAILTDAEGRVIAEVKGPSASIQSGGIEASAAALDDVVTRLGQMAENAAVVLAGSAGLDTPAAAERLAALLEQRFRRARVTCIHDAELLLAAAEEDAGCVFIFGTGSCAWAKGPDGRTARVGGWGWVLGDDTSGFGVVRATIRAALADHDRDAPPSVLTRSLLAAVGLERPMELIDAFYSRPGSGVWAQHVPVVLEAYRAGEPAAVAIVDTILDKAANEIDQACRRVDITGPVILAGGVAMNIPEWSQGLAHRLGDRGLSEVRVLGRDPVWGAVDLAVRQL